MSVRAQVIAKESRSIEESQNRAIAVREDERRPRTALEAMSQRLQVSTKSLQNTLMSTAFKGCSDAEFVALVIVANAFDLNPLLREIYAFPKKGGGIQAIVGYDGWIKIADRHPQYDGYEADHITDEKGNIQAIEGVCYRKDRTHPTKKIVYLKEFKRNTDPWNNSPNHMLDVRAFCQTIRLGLGVSGLGVEGIDDVDGGELRPHPVALPDNRSMGEQLDDEIPALKGEAVDEETGEVTTDNRGMTEVDEETARKLDAGDQAEDEGPTDEAEGDEPTGETDEPATEEESPSDAKLRELHEKIEAAKTPADLKKVDAEWVKAAGAYDDDTQKDVNAALAAKHKALREDAKGGEG